MTTLTAPVLSQHNRGRRSKSRQSQEQTSVALTLAGSRKWHHIAGTPAQEFTHTGTVWITRRGDDVPCVRVFRFNLRGRVRVGNGAGHFTSTHEDSQDLGHGFGNPFRPNNPIDDSVAVQIV